LKVEEEKMHKFVISWTGWADKEIFSEVIEAQDEYAALCDAYLRVNGVEFGGERILGNIKNAAFNNHGMISAIKI
jgi:hypothetical protein